MVAGAGTARALSAPPSVTSVSPDSGPAAGGTTVTIMGDNLAGTATVTFGPGNEATNEGCSPLYFGPCVLVVVSPPGTGTVDVQVTENGETSVATSADQFTYTAQATATSVTSSANPAQVGTPVTYTATVSPAPGGGTVSFTDNGSAITGCQDLPVASAACSQTYSGAGADNIVAAYSGTAGFAASTSPVFSEIITTGHCSSLAGCNLQGTDLNSVNLPGANLNGSNLQGASVQGADLDGATLQGAGSPDERSNGYAPELR